MFMKKAQSILFDLDGTLLDTAPDLVAALNAVLLAHGRTERPLSEARPYVSRGARGLLACGFALHESAEEYSAYVQEFLGYYRGALCEKSSLFDGMPELLAHLDEHKVKWGVVTNKVADLTEPLLKQLDLFERLDVLVSGDTLEEKKPSPMPLLYACEKAGIQPEDTLYVGDDPRDIEAANAAGMVSVAAAYGYFDATEDPQQWGADHVIEHPRQLLDLLATSTATGA